MFMNVDFFKATMALGPATQMFAISGHGILRSHVWSLITPSSRMEQMDHGSLLKESC